MQMKGTEWNQSSDPQDAGEGERSANEAVATKASCKKVEAATQDAARKKRKSGFKGTKKPPKEKRANMTLCQRRQASD
jgi:hypothetical protein